MEDLLDSLPFPMSPSWIIILSVGTGVLLGGTLAWMGAEAIDPRLLRILIAAVGAAAGGFLGFLAGVILVVALLGALAGLVVGGGALLIGHYGYANDSWLLLLVPAVCGAGIGALIGLGFLVATLARQKAGNRALLLVGFLLVGSSGWFYGNGAQVLKRQSWEQQEQRAKQEEEEKQAIRGRLQAAAREVIAAPDALNANPDGKKAYEAWHRAGRLLQEYHGLVGGWKTSAGLDEREDCTVEQLTTLAAGATDADVKQLLEAIKDAWVASRREEKEAAEKSVKSSGGAIQITPTILLDPGPRGTREKAIQVQADDCMTRLGSRYGVEFARIPVWNGDKPAPGSEDEALARLVPGIWTREVTNDPVRIFLQETWWSDGKFLMTGTVTNGDQCSPVTIRGIWRIEKKKLHTRLLSTSGPVAVGPGTVAVDEIITLAQDEWTIRDSQGNVETARRVRK